jgi:hypothetical protein
MKVKILFCLFFCFGLGASAQVIDIYITNQLNDSDKKELSGYVEFLNKDFGKRNKGLTINFVDYYNDFQTIIFGENDINNFVLDENKSFQNEGQFLVDIQGKLNLSQVGLIPAASGKLPACSNLLKDREIFKEFVKAELKRARRKKEKCIVEVIYYNGYMLGKQDVKRLELSFRKAENNRDFSRLKPRFSWEGDKTFLPNSFGYYTIEFDSVGFYSSYIIQIESLSKDNPGNLIFEEIKFDRNNPDLILKYTGNNRTCELQISAEYLGTKCLQMSAGKMELNLDCSECQETCLYHKAFQLRMRGVCGEFKSEKLWQETDLEYNTKFQCKNLMK